MVEPEISRLTLGGDDHGTVLLRSASAHVRGQVVAAPGTGRTTVRVYDGQGHPFSTHRTQDDTTRVVLPAGGFAVVRR